MEVVLYFVGAADVQQKLAEHIRKKREAAGLSREALAEKSLVPASTLKKFELTGQISLRQFLLLWQVVDHLVRLHLLTQKQQTKAPASIEEVLKDEF